MQTFFYFYVEVDYMTKKKQSRMVNVLLKEDMLKKVDDTLKEDSKPSDLYAPKEYEDDNLASFISEEDFLSEYDRFGNKIKVYEKKKEKPNASVVNVFLLFTFILIIFIIILFIIIIF